MLHGKDNLYTRDELLSLGIYELRDLGRDVGVPSPTTLKKEALVDMILSIIYGEVPKRNIGKGRGRPARIKDKPNRLFVDLIEKIEEPKCTRTFVYSDNEVEAVFPQNGFLSTKVASAVSNYVNDSEEGQKTLLKTGVVCEEDGKYFSRKLKFIKSNDDCEIPLYIIKDYGLKENDRIEYLLDDDGKTMIQLFKVNNDLAEKKVTRNSLIDLEDNKELYIQESKIVLNSSNIIYSATLQDREGLVDGISRTLESMDYNTVTVCFDRNESIKKENLGLAKSEIYASYIGDEFETMAMAESGIDKAVFYSMLGNKSVLIIDNLAWLLSVIDTYPTSIYGNFIEKMVKTCSNSNVTLICITGHLNNEKIKELSNYFKNIN